MNISNEECFTHGYQQTTNFKRKKFNVTSWDEVLYYFCLLSKNYSFVWFIEDAVFISSINAFYLLHQLYSNESDLVTPNNKISVMGRIHTPFWFWNLERLVVP